MANTNDLKERLLDSIFGGNPESYSGLWNEDSESEEAFQVEGSGITPEEIRDIFKNRIQELFHQVNTEKERLDDLWEEAMEQEMTRRQAAAEQRSQLNGFGSKIFAAIRDFFENREREQELRRQYEEKRKICMWEVGFKFLQGIAEALQKPEEMEKSE